MKKILGSLMAMATLLSSCLVVKEYEKVNINETILKIMAVKMKHLMPLIIDGQQKKIFTNKITSDEFIHIVMGTFRLQMFKWRVANFQFDISRNGDNMIQSVLTLIKNK